jgi:hypothetical protein
VKKCQRKTLWVQSETKSTAEHPNKLFLTLCLREYIYITFLANAHFAIGPVGAALVAALQSIVFRWQDVRCSNDSNGKPALHSFAQTFLDTTIDKARPIY